MKKGTQYKICDMQESVKNADRHRNALNDLTLYYTNSITLCTLIPLIKLPNHKLRRLRCGWQPEEPNSGSHHEK